MEAAGRRQTSVSCRIVGVCFVGVKLTWRRRGGTDKAGLLFLFVLNHRFLAGHNDGFAPCLFDLLFGGFAETMS